VQIILVVRVTNRALKNERGEIMNLIIAKIPHCIKVLDFKHFMKYFVKYIHKFESCIFLLKL